MTSWQFKALKTFFRLKHWFETGTPSLEKRRRSYENMTSQFVLDPEVRITPAALNGVPVEWVMPPDSPAGRVVLFFHGGAYCLCSVKTHRALAVHLAMAARSPVANVAYRLAPEHPFPAAVKDAVSAYQALLDMDVAPENIIVAGDSAGGGLALALLLSVRDAELPLPAAAVCISPWTDLTLSGASMTVNARKDVMLDDDSLTESARFYLDGTDPRTPLASPLFADFHHMPPLLIQVGSDEIILSDAEGVAEKARAAGVDVTLDIWQGMQHEWQFAAQFVPEGQAAIARIGAFMQAHFADPENHPHKRT
ncbi:MAG: alpha/beta hydrolase [Anaerolineae bacterium]|nr:alpha/beta hydrolase [Anaerolineae bacterium]